MCAPVSTKSGEPVVVLLELLALLVLVIIAGVFSWMVMRSVVEFSPREPRTRAELDALVRPWMR
jgi:hypothetical protein